MLPALGLQLPHLVFIRCTKNRSTFTPISGSHLAISGGTACLELLAIPFLDDGLLLRFVGARAHPQEHAAVLQLD